MSTKKLVTILLPCLNEEKTLDKCIKGIKKVMDKSKYKDKYTILVCDNNSTDNSVNICKKNKVDYTICKQRGNGATLRNGIKKAKTEYLAMLDADGSYDERDLPKMIDLLEDYDLVVGNRFKGTIEKNAMPKKNRIGSTFLSNYNNLLFHTPIHDYHCGMRAFKRKEILKCELESIKFELATEMILKAKVHHLKMIEVPTNLFKDGRDRKPHLKPFKDGIDCFHFANKVKWKNSIFFRYFTTFIAVLLLLFSLLFLSQLIPHKAIEKNALKSNKELDIQFKHKKDRKPNEIYEKVGDLRLLSITYNQNEKKPLKSLIEMNYNKNCDEIVTNCISNSKDDNEIIQYSRYWHGQTIFEKVLLVFTTIKKINIINLILILLLFFLAIKKLWKIDKKLMIGFILALLSINLFFVTTSLQYNMVVYITLIITNILLNMLLKKSKNIDILFLISGILTCFFDFLTAETLTLSIPLLIYVYIKQKDKELKIKEVIKFALLWLIGYSMMFLSKWLIATIHYGPHMFKEILNDASIRITYSKGTSDKVIKYFIKSLYLLIPFNYLNNGGIIALLLVITTFIFNLFLNKKNIIYYLLLIIPLARYFIILSHSSLFYYFAYRSFGIITPLLFFTIYDIIKEIIGDKEYEEKSN